MSSNNINNKFFEKFNFCMDYMYYQKCERGTKCIYMHLSKVQYTIYHRCNRMTPWIVKEAWRTQQNSAFCDIEMRYKNRVCVSKECKKVHRNQGNLITCPVCYGNISEITAFLCGHYVCSNCYNSLRIVRDFEPIYIHRDICCPVCRAEGSHVFHGKSCTYVFILVLISNSSTSRILFVNIYFTCYLKLI